MPRLSFEHPPFLSRPLAKSSALPADASPAIKDFVRRIAHVCRALEESHRRLVDSDRETKMLADVRAIPGYACYARYWGDAAEFHASNLCRPFVCWRQPDLRNHDCATNFDGSPLAGLIDFDPTNFPDVELPILVSEEELSLLREITRHRQPSRFPKLFSDATTSADETISKFVRGWQEQTDRKNEFYRRLADGDSVEEVFHVVPDANVESGSRSFVVDRVAFAAKFDDLLGENNPTVPNQQAPWGFEENYWAHAFEGIDVSPGAKVLLETWKSVRAEIDRLHAELRDEVQSRWRASVIECARDPETALDFGAFCRFWGFPELRISGANCDWEYSDGEICPCLVSGMRFNNKDLGRPETDEESALVEEFARLERIAQSQTRTRRNLQDWNKDENHFDAVVEDV